MFRVKAQFDAIVNPAAENSNFYKQFKKMSQTLAIGEDLPEVKSIQDEAKVYFKLCLSK
jgi:hypothetical protein